MKWYWFICFDFVHEYSCKKKFLASDRREAMEMADEWCYANGYDDYKLIEGSVK